MSWESDVFCHDKALVSPDANIGKGTRVWAFANIQAGAKIGSNCNICDGTFIEKGVTVGNNVTIKHNVSIFDGVTIEDDVFIGSNIAFINDRYPRSNREDDWVLEKTHIAKGATLGSNATILCGLKVGEYAFVGAGSVVTKDVSAYAIVCGNPAKKVANVCQCGKKLDENYQCQCSRNYCLKGEELYFEE